MHEISRRKLFVLTSAALAGGVLKDQMPEFEQLSLLRAYQTWRDRQAVDPLNYLRQRDMAAKCTHAELEAMIVDDFRNQRCMILDGLIVSETEAAMLAFVGQQIT